MIDPLLDTIIVSAMTLTAISVFYRKTTAFDLLEMGIVGAGAGIFFVVGLQESVRGVIEPLIQGDATLIFPLLVGIAFFFMFVPRLAFWYRFAISLAIILPMGPGVAALMITAYKNIQGWTMFLNPAQDLMILIGVATGISYMVFTRKVSGMFRYPGRLGVYFIYACLGSLCAEMIYRFSNYAIPQLWRVAEPIGLVLAAIAMILILVDYMVLSKRKVEQII
jgi:hypothetical protein